MDRTGLADQTALQNHPSSHILLPAMLYFALALSSAHGESTAVIQLKTGRRALRTALTLAHGCHLLNIRRSKDNPQSRPLSVPDGGAPRSSPERTQT